MTTTSTASSDLGVLDTNVLVYALDSESAHHAEAAGLLRRALGEDAGLCVTPQNLAEFFAVVTNPRRVRRAVSSSEAVAIIGEFLALPGLSLIPVSPDVVSRWVELVGRYPVTGSSIYDLQLVATMVGNGIRRIYTYNRADFEAIEELEVLSP